MSPAESRTEDPISAVASAVREAFARARASAPLWADLPPGARLSVLRRFRHRLAAESDALAATVPRPSAETLSAQLIPLADAIRFLETEAPKALAPRSSRLGRRPFWLLGTSLVVHREPLGVVLVIAPSNYPLFIPGTQLVQALAAGNGAIIKPGPGGHPAALALLRLLTDSGLPEGLVSVLPETPEAGRLAIEQHPDRILFTGSSETGRAVLEEAARRLIPCTVELSGSDAVIVRADADLDRVVAALVFGLRLNAGATCIAPRRVFVTSSLSKSLEQRLATALASLPPMALPPVQADRLAPLLRDAVSQGARHLPIHGFTVSHPVPQSGPVVLFGVPPTAAILRADLFAPVLSVVEVESEEAALELAGSGPFALGASVFTSDPAAGDRIARRLAAGVVTINDLIVPTADPRVPFGGRAGSGYGITRGLEGLLELTRPKAISARRVRWAPHLAPPGPHDASLFAAALALVHGNRWTCRARALLRLIQTAMRRTPVAPPPTPEQPSGSHPAISHP